MATPDYKFTLPGTNFDFYVIWNTFYEAPHTVPMDLITFLDYHLQSNRLFEGLFYCWEDLNDTGSTLSDCSFEDLDVNEKDALFQLCIDSGALDKAKQNVLINKQLKNAIDKNHKDEIVCMAMVQALLDESKLFETNYYYTYWSHHFTIEEFWEYNNIWGFMNYYHDADHRRQFYELLILLFRNNKIEPFVVPHLFRRWEPLRTYLIERGYADYVPIVKIPELDFISKLNHQELSSKLEQEGQLLYYTQDWVKDNEELVEIAAKSQPSSFVFASDRLRNDRAFILKLFFNFPYQENTIYPYLPD